MLCATLAISWLLVVHGSLILESGADSHSSNNERRLIGGASWRKRALRRQKDGEYDTLQPIVGVLTNPCDHAGCLHRALVAGPVVDWLASAGARVVPIRYYASEEEMRRVLRSVNGLLFPGGSGDLHYHSEFTKGARTLLRLALEMNDEGIFFPLQAICLGFELLHVELCKQDSDVLLVHTDAESETDGLNFTASFKDSVYFHDMPEHLLEGLTRRTEGLTYNAHEWGVVPSRYEQFPRLNDYLQILSTTNDRKGLTYVSTVEGRQYPLLATQWHPEKPPYDFGDAAMPHTKHSIDVSYHIARAFVDLTRLNPNKMEHEEYLKHSIYTHHRTFAAASGKWGSIFPDTMYFIDHISEVESVQDIMLNSSSSAAAL